MVSFLTPDEAVSRIPNNGTVAITGSGGGILEPDAILAAIERRFLATGEPHGLTVIHALGIGDAKNKGLTHLAHKGLVECVIGGHWSWSPAMQDLAASGEIEAYALPAGVIGALLRETGTRRPGLITRVGLQSFVDPRLEGGSLNDRSKRELCEILTLDGEEFLRYFPIKIDVAIVRGTASDRYGNVSFSDEPSFLDSDAVALAAKGSQGLVICQVRDVIDHALPPQSVHLPSTMVDLVVENPDQWQTYASRLDPALVSSSVNAQNRSSNPVQATDVRSIIARRAALELVPGSLINVGFGMSSLVVDVVAGEGKINECSLVIEQGAVGGKPVSGDLFGVSIYPQAILPSTRQFDFFNSCALDVCFLGMAEVDQHGNVNVSKIGSTAVGPGGFIDIVHGARTAVFCGPLTAKGLRVSVESGRLRIDAEGSVHKFTNKVNQITYSARQAISEGRKALYITERAVFELGPEGIELKEIAEGLDVERDVLAHMDFIPAISSVKTMPSRVFDNSPLFPDWTTTHEEMEKK